MTAVVRGQPLVMRGLEAHGSNAGSSALENVIGEIVTAF